MKSITVSTRGITFVTFLITLYNAVWFYLLINTLGPDT